MRRLLKLSMTIILQSLLPIVMWHVAGMLYSSPSVDYSNGFTLTYSM